MYGPQGRGLGEQELAEKGDVASYLRKKLGTHRAWPNRNFRCNFWDGPTEPTQHGLKKSVACGVGNRTAGAQNWEGFIIPEPGGTGGWYGRVANRTGGKRDKFAAGSRLC